MEIHNLTRKSFAKKPKNVRKWSSWASKLSVETPELTRYICSFPLRSCLGARGYHCGLGEKTGEAWYQYRGLVPHDFRRSAVRNLVNSGVDTATAMKITGHRTLHIFMRDNIISTG